MIANITVDSFISQSSGFTKFKDKSQKTWNCNVPEVIAQLAVGERFHIDYNETEPKPGHKFGSKYINRMRSWRESDGANTWPDKEPYTGNSGGSYGGGKVKSDYDPEIGKRQTAANCAGNIIAHYVQATKKVDLDEINATFPTLAEIVLKFINAKGNGLAATGDGGSSAAGGFDDEEF